MHKRRNSSALAIELRLSCTYPSNYSFARCAQSNRWAIQCVCLWSTIKPSIISIIFWVALSYDQGSQWSGKSQWKVNEFETALVLTTLTIKRFYNHVPSDISTLHYTLSYCHDQIGSMTHLPLFRVRSWNNDIRCMFFYILIDTNEVDVTSM